VNTTIIWEILRRSVSTVEPGTVTDEQMEAALEAIRQQIEKIQGDIGAIPERKPVLEGPLRIRWPNRRPGAPPAGPGFEFGGPEPPRGPRPVGAPLPEVRSIGRRIGTAIKDNLAQIVLGAIGLGALRSGSRAAPSSAISLALPSPSTIRPTQPLTVVQGAALPLTATRTASQQCECKSKKKRKRRKCLEMADVGWTSGRYKGKKAGRRCVRFAKET